MEGSILPIAVAHGEGRAVASEANIASLNASNQVALRYVDSYGNPTQHYPLNPNGSPEATVTSKDGRATIMMPHQSVLSVQFNTLGVQKSGLKMVHGYVCSVTHVSLLVNN